MSTSRLHILIIVRPITGSVVDPELNSGNLVASCLRLSYCERNSQIKTTNDKTTSYQD